MEDIPSPALPAAAEVLSGAAASAVLCSPTLIVLLLLEAGISSVGRMGLGECPIAAAWAAAVESFSSDDDEPELSPCLPSCTLSSSSESSCGTKINLCTRFVVDSFYRKEVKKGRFELTEATSIKKTKTEATEFRQDRTDTRWPRPSSPFPPSNLLIPTC